MNKNIRVYNVFVHVLKNLEKLFEQHNRKLDVMTETVNKFIATSNNFIKSSLDFHVLGKLTNQSFVMEPKIKEPINVDDEDNSMNINDQASPNHEATTKPIFKTILKIPIKPKVDPFPIVIVGIDGDDDVHIEDVTNNETNDLSKNDEGPYPKKGKGKFIMTAEELAKIPMIA
ncbi:hypothetical protein L2E82_15262 [Cichorium intybus]|uniref:Uncharacterized protein n=1 Tax=Cichorium intybus TaxID=13427 RepID=A0ACB9F2B8_CICIN|nr:hypothetical protein L2E82_15262 [Cichorium intybus]